MGEFNNILKQLRLEKGLMQTKIAEDLGISKSSYSLYESGKREPNMEMLEKIADYFNVDIDFLLGRTNKMFEEYFEQQQLLNIDNKERHHLLIYYYNTLECTGRDSLMEILANLQVLNKRGQKEASKRVEELTEIPRYTKPDD